MCTHLFIYLLVMRAICYSWHSHMLNSGMVFGYTESNCITVWRFCQWCLVLQCIVLVKHASKGCLEATWWPNEGLLNVTSRQLCHQEAFKWPPSGLQVSSEWPSSGIYLCFIFTGHIHGVCVCLDNYYIPVFGSTIPGCRLHQSKVFKNYDTYLWEAFIPVAW